MATRHSGTAIVLEFSSRPALDFGQIVQAFDTTMHPCGPGPRQITWDGNDLAILYRGPLRIALGWVKPCDRKPCWYLVIAAGSSKDGDTMETESAAWDALGDRIVAQVERIMRFDNVFRGQISQPIDADLIDLLTELVLSTPAEDTAAKPTDIDEDDPQSYAFWSAHALRSRAAPEVNAPLDGTCAEQDRIRQLREIMVAPEDEAIGMSTHLIIYSLCLALFLQVPKIGDGLSLNGVFQSMMSVI